MKRCVYIGAISSAVSFSRRAGSLSGPPAFEGFILLKSFAIPICPKVMLGISGCVDRIWGRVSRFSDVNTEVNCLTRALALLVSVAAGMPVGVCSVGMPWLSFLRDFMYDQNGLVVESNCCMTPNKLQESVLWHFYVLLGP